MILRFLLAILLFSASTSIAQTPTGDPVTGNSVRPPLSESEKTQLQAQIGIVKKALDSAMADAEKGDWTSVTNNLRACVASIVPLNRWITSDVERFPFGLSLAGVVSVKMNPKRELGVKFLETFIPIASTSDTRGVDEALRLVLLQQYYHLGKWDLGAEQIRAAQAQGIISAQFVKESLGFCSGMITKGKRTNSVSLCSSILEEKTAVKDPAFNRGEALMSLSHLCSSDKNFKLQLKTLDRIEKEAPEFYKTNVATVSYFRFAGYKWTGDPSNSLAQLIIAAKAAQSNPEYVTDPMMRETLPELLKQYQDAGMIDKDLKVVFGRIPLPPSKAPNNRILALSILGVSLVGLFFGLTRFSRKKS